jgi:hypothetical protein
MLLGFDRTLDGSSNNFDGGMIDGGIDRGKSGFFPGVDDPIFEGGIFFDGFDRFFPAPPSPIIRSLASQI